MSKKATIFESILKKSNEFDFDRENLYFTFCKIYMIKIAILLAVLIVLSFPFFLTPAMALGAAQGNLSNLTAMPEISWDALAKKLSNLNSSQTQEIPGAHPGVVLSMSYVGPTKKVVHIYYSPETERRFLLASIFQKLDGTDSKKEYVIFNTRQTTYINKISPQTVLSYQWQRNAIMEVNKFLTNEPIIESLKDAGKNLLRILLFSTRKVENLLDVTEQFEKAVNEIKTAIKETENNQLLSNDQATEPIIRFQLEFLKQSLAQTEKMQNSEILKASAELAGFIGLDVATIAPKTVIVPLVNAWGRISALAAEKVSTTRVSNSLGNIVKVNQSKDAAELESKLESVTLALKAKLLGSIEKINVYKGILTAAMAPLRMSQYIWTKISTIPSKYPGLERFMSISHAFDCSTSSPERKRLWLINFVYNIPLVLTTQFLIRRDLFLEQIDGVLVDLINAQTASYIIGRCSYKSGRVNTESAFQVWQDRQFTGYVTTVQDSILQYLRLISDSNGLTPQDWEYIQNRILANLSYNLTRGGTLNSIVSGNNRNLNSGVVQALNTGQSELVVKAIMQEAISRSTVVLSAQGVHLSYRSGIMEKANSGGVDELPRLLANAFTETQTEINARIKRNEEALMARETNIENGDGSEDDNKIWLY